MTQNKSSRKFIVTLAAVALIVLAAILFFALRGGPDEAKGHPSTWSASTRQKVDDAYNAALFHLQSNDLVKARVIINKMIEDYPQAPQSHLLHGQVLIYDGKLAEAYAALARSLELDPAQAEAHQTAGIIAEQIGEADKARYHYTRATALSPKDPRYPLYLGQLLLKQNQLDEAQMQVLKAVQLDAKLVAGYALLAEIAARKGKWDMAIDHATRAIDQSDVDDPKRLRYVLLKAQYLRRNAQPEIAVEMLHRLPLDQQLTAEVTPHIADGYLMMSRPADAAKAWGDLFYSDTTNARAAAESGMCWLRAGELSKARQMRDLAARVNAGEPLIKALDEAMMKARAASAG